MARLAFSGWDDGVAGVSAVTAFLRCDSVAREVWPDITVTPRTFFGVPSCRDVSALDAEVAFLGIPHEATFGAPGARLGPDALRDARIYDHSGFRIGGQGAPGYFDLDSGRQRLEGLRMSDCGDVPFLPMDAETNRARVTRAVRAIVERAPMIVAVGGDHSVTPAVVRGLERHGRVDVVQFDAHHDYFDEVAGQRWLAGMAMRRTCELPFVGRMTQVGLRAARGPREPIDAALARGNVLMSADRFRAIGAEAAMAEVPDSDALYITLDIDVLDPSVCPGTGTPEPGGLAYIEMRDCLRALARRSRIVGLDVVEVSPPLDHPTGITSKTAARLILDLLAARTA